MAAPARHNDASNRSGRPSGRHKNGSRRGRRTHQIASTLSHAQRIIGRHVGSDAADLRDEVGLLVQDIENRLDRLNALTRRGASHAADGVNDLASGAVSRVADRVRRGARGASNDAAKLGNTALNRVAHEIEKRPLLTLAIAVGLGIAAGFARRSN
jgi:ElaB/YqjD/DUF883 family membrane-anchored ribosome-binding protein